MNGDSYYFGYGSLVNRQTRDAAEPWFEATLNGWIRQWAHQAKRPWSLQNSRGSGVCAVTVIERENSSIDGVLVPIASADLPQLDEREAGYHRVMLPMSAFTFHRQPGGLTEDSQVTVYVSNENNNEWANRDTPLITSYVHCVMAGFEDVYGADGLERFMLTTEGWSLPLLDDRHQPLYPRAVALNTQRQSRFDRYLQDYALRDNSA